MYISFLVNSIYVYMYLILYHICIYVSLYVSYMIYILAWYISICKSYHRRSVKIFKKFFFDFKIYFSYYLFIEVRGEEGRGFYFFYIYYIYIKKISKDGMSIHVPMGHLGPKPLTIPRSDVRVNHSSCLVHTLVQYH